MPEGINIEDIQFKMKGSVCLFYSIDNQTVVVPDPLGGAVLYYYDSPAIKIFSNSLNNILFTLDKLKIQVEKEVNYILENIATGNGGLINSPYKNIYSLSQFSYVNIFNGEITISENTIIKDYIRNSRKRSYNNILKTALEDIMDNIKCVSSFNNAGCKYSHLTGGFDSRLILASLISCDEQYNYKYYCSGREGSPDKDISIKLSKHFGLTQTNDSGQQITKHPENLKEEVLWSMNFTGGIIKTLNPHVKNKDNIILSGGYGELLRTFYTQENDFATFNSYEEIVKKLWKNLSEDNNLFTDSFRSKFAQRFREVITQGLKLGFPEDTILDYYYLAIRNRYFVGQISLYASVFNARFDPLYSCKAAIDALFLPKEMRLNNFLGLDIMKNLEQELLYLPFDTPRINDSYKKCRPGVEMKDFKSNYEMKYENIDLNHTFSKVRKQASQEDQRKANKMKARLWQVVEMKNMQDELKKLFKNYHDEKINENLNIYQIEKLVYKEIKNRVDLRTLNLLYSNLIWWLN